MAKKPTTLLTVVPNSAVASSPPAQLTQAQIMECLTPEIVGAWLATQAVANKQNELFLLIEQMPKDFFVFAVFYAQIFATDTQTKALEKKGLLSEDKSQQEVALAYWNSFPLIKQLKILQGLVALNPNIIKNHEADDVRILQEAIYKTYEVFCEGKITHFSSHSYLTAVYKNIKKQKEEQAI